MQNISSTLKINSLLAQQLDLVFKIKLLMQSFKELNWLLLKKKSLKL